MTHYQLWQISAADLKEKLELKDYKHLLDVRPPVEWAMGGIKEAEHLPLTELLKGAPDIPKNEEIVVTCGMGYSKRHGCQAYIVDKYAFLTNCPNHAFHPMNG